MSGRPIRHRRGTSPPTSTAAVTRTSSNLLARACWCGATAFDAIGGFDALFPSRVVRGRRLLPSADCRRVAHPVRGRRARRARGGHRHARARPGFLFDNLVPEPAPLRGQPRLAGRTACSSAPSSSSAWLAAYPCSACCEAARTTPGVRWRDWRRGWGVEPPGYSAASRPIPVYSRSLPDVAEIDSSPNRMRLAALLTALLLLPFASPARPALDAQDREAFLAWFTLLADAQFYRATPDVTDCAALVRHAAREALREHTPEWQRRPPSRVDTFAPKLRVAPDCHGRQRAAVPRLRDNAGTLRRVRRRPHDPSPQRARSSAATPRPPVRVTCWPSSRPGSACPST